MTNKKELLYMQLANTMEYQIQNNVLKTGDRLPSLRAIASEKGVSINTIQQAYFELESRGLIESRPQSGYYVSYIPKSMLKLPAVSQPIMAKKGDEIVDIMSAVIQNFETAEIYLSSANLTSEHVPIAKLNKSVIAATRSLKDSGVGYSKVGSVKLKTQIAKRAVSWGGQLQSDDIITTGGSIDSISFCLLSLTKRGDTIVVESPVYFGILRLAQSLGLHVIELPTHPVTGIELDSLKSVIEKKKVKLCILITNFSNPMGCSMPDAHKQEVVRLMEKHNIPLVEDDLYADLYFGKHRPKSCKSYDESGIVLWCGSFSKTLASGYRVGWVAPGKFKDQVERTKLFHSMYSSTITHEAIGHFLEVGRYEDHLRKTRQILQRNSLQFLKCISEYFPGDTKVTRPEGGMNLWLELGPQKDTIEIYNRAISKKISITPGRMYTLQNQYNHCLKLSYGMHWDEKIENALMVLGEIVCKQ